MKSTHIFWPRLAIFILSLSLFVPHTTFAEINGSVETIVNTQIDPVELTHNTNNLRLKFEGTPLDNYHYFSEIGLKGLRLFEAGETYDWKLDVTEAYLDLYKFLSDKLDVRVGKQIIVWGKADKLNPTSNVCPDDLSNPFDFGEKVGVNAFNATFYLPGNFSINGIVVPEFTPATLPSGDFASLLGGSPELPPDMTLRRMTQNTVYPERTFAETSQFALKLNGMVLGYDFSLSYFQGRDDLPVVNRVTLLPVDAQGTLDLTADLMFPKLHVIGADFARTLGSVGIWGEGALFFPEKVERTTVLKTPQGILPRGTAISQKDDPYVKFVLGSDYTFASGWYVNTQFVHGFFHERSRDELQDYFITRFEKKLLRETVKIVPLGLALAIPDWSDLGQNYALVGNPEITYYPTDNVELNLGAVIIEGKGENVFSQFKNQDEFYFNAKVSF